MWVLCRKNSSHKVVNYYRSVDFFSFIIFSMIFWLSLLLQILHIACIRLKNHILKVFDAGPEVWIHLRWTEFELFDFFQIYAFSQGSILVNLAQNHQITPFHQSDNEKFGKFYKSKFKESSAEDKHRIQNATIPWHSPDCVEY